jgi:hypothetical protein
MVLSVPGYNRGELRRAIGRSLGILETGEATSTVDSTSLRDSVWFARFADGEINGDEILIYDPTGSIVAGEYQFITDFADADDDATLPAFSDSITDGDKYEHIKQPWTHLDIEDAINQAILKASARCMQHKQTEDTFTKPDTYLYPLSGFKAVHMIEHEYDIGESVEVEDCDEAFTAGTNATVTADTDHYIEGTASNKIVVAAGAGAGEILAYKAITSIDLSGCNKLEISIYSTIALTAGQMQVRLDDTAGGGSPVEELDIPATSANTWTRHIITLANPLSDTAVIHVDIYQVSDVGAFTLYVDYIRAVDSYSRRYLELNPEYWQPVRASTNLLQLTHAGKSVIGDNKLLRISGYDLPDALSDDTTDVEIDPDFIINYAKGLLMTGHSKSRSLDFENREKKGQDFLTLAMQRLNTIATNPAPNTRYL